MSSLVTIKSMGIFDQGILKNSLFVADSLRRPPLVDDIVAVNYEETFHRGQILGIEGEKFLVRLLDRGDEVSVHWKEMKSLPDQLKLVSNTFEFFTEL